MARLPWWEIVGRGKIGLGENHKSMKRSSLLTLLGTITRQEEAFRGFIYHLIMDQTE